jgi:hypothetical protein
VQLILEYLNSFNCQQKVLFALVLVFLGQLGLMGLMGLIGQIGLMGLMGQGIVVRPARKMQRMWWDATFDGGSGMSKEDREQGGW